MNRTASFLVGLSLLAVAPGAWAEAGEAAPPKAGVAPRGMPSCEIGERGKLTEKQVHVWRALLCDELAYRFQELLRDDLSAILINPYGVDEVQLRRHQFGLLRDLTMGLALEPLLLDLGTARVGAEEARRFAGYRRVRFEGGQGVWPEVISLSEERPAMPIFLTDDAVRSFIEHYRETTAHHPLEITTETAPDLVLRARALGVDTIVVIGLGVVKEWPIAGFLSLLGAGS